MQSLKRVLSKGSLNPNVVKAEYAVRGEIAVRAEQLESMLKDPAQRQKLPFDKVVYCNIGNPQQLGQSPISFYRQVASLVEDSDLLARVQKDESLRPLFPKDVVNRAQSIVDYCGGRVGPYTSSKGYPVVRKHVAEFIHRRDGGVHMPNTEHIFLTTGASQGVNFLLQALINSPKAGVMIPIPQYPLYTATLALLNGTPVPYYLHEESGWTLGLEELKKSVKTAREQGVDVRALVVINPGNPVGNLLSRENMESVVSFCQSENLVLMADEVYQTNVYRDDRQFVSFKKVVCDMKSPVELVSFHSISKGIIGECGRRGGYFELYNFDDQVVDQLYKLSSISLCPNAQGQIMVDLMVKPPVQGDESYETFKTECDSIFQSLKRRAKKLVNGLNQMEGVSCQQADGAMYVFPQITLPEKAVQAAQNNGKKPDAFYAMELLNSTGVCVVPGSGFGQREGTWHFRATFLPPEDEFDSFISKIQDFHAQFMDKYRS
ncbi:hypothetical protein MP228_005597 [Amoeboaphelidium protococcarum]|nr:hypothetical protein MP228_005597 [Amoeboaphelidium protococcarum]